MRQIIFLGTSYGMPKVGACASILVEDETNSLLLDVGGGHEIIRQLYRAGKKPAEINNIFISHYDTDHILGIFPLVRSLKGLPEGKTIHIFCSAEVQAALESLFSIVAKKHWETVKKMVRFVILTDGLSVIENDWKLTFFDLKSTKSPQFGCVIEFTDGKKVSFLGDEPLKDAHTSIVAGSDILIHEAFCLDADQERFTPHPKNHSTVKEAAANASKVGAKMLALCHMEDETLATRKQAYAAEAATQFNGEIFVPIDLDTLPF